MERDGTLLQLTRPGSGMKKKKKKERFGPLNPPPLNVFVDNASSVLCLTNCLF
jgi:hypothetical protein